MNKLVLAEEENQNNENTQKINSSSTIGGVDKLKIYCVTWNLQGQVK